MSTFSRDEARGHDHDRDREHQEPQHSVSGATPGKRTLTQGLTAPQHHRLHPAGRGPVELPDGLRGDSPERAAPATEGGFGAEPAAPAAASPGATLASDGGAALAPDVRAPLERGFGRDLGGVRVHTGAAAAASTQELGASAYAAGDHIAFAPGQFAPDTHAGQWLLAHEVAHTVQQGGADGLQLKSLEVGSDSDPSESAADAAADRIMQGDTGVAASLSASGPAVRRKLSAPLPGPRVMGISPRLEASGHVQVQRKVAGTLVNVARTTFERDMSIQLVPASEGIISVAGSGLWAVGRKGFFQMAGGSSFDFSARWLYELSPAGALTLTRTESGISAGEQTEGTSLDLTVAELADAVTMTFLPGASPIAGRKFGVEAGGKGATVGTDVEVGGDTGAARSAVTARLRFLGVHEATSEKGGDTTTNIGNNSNNTVNVFNNPPTAKDKIVVDERSLTVFFAQEEATEDPVAERAVIKWAQRLFRTPAEDAIRSGRLKVTIRGYASTTGKGDTNDRISAARSRWVWGILHNALDLGGARPLFVGERLAKTADEVPAPEERKVDIYIVGE